jgi:CBS domain-containing protein
MVLRAKDIMDTSFLTVDEDVVALECAQRMVERRKGYAVVTRGGTTKASGIVTEWDFLEKVVAPGIDPTQRRVRDLASTTVHSCSPDTPTDEVVTAMSNLGVRRMVVRTDDRVVGVITAKNVIAIFREYVDKLTSEIAGFQSTQTPLG